MKKAKKLNGKFDGKITLDEIQFSEIRTETISYNNETSGKINFPKSNIGKTVYILYPKEGNLK